MAKPKVAELFEAEAMEVVSPFSAEEDSETLDLDIALDVDKIAAQEQSLLLARGTYVWDGTPRVTSMHQTEDIAVGDYSQKGRLLIIIGGMVRQMDDPTKRGAFTLYLSPDTRLYNGEADGRVKTWARFTGAFFKQHERAPRTLREVVDFVAGAHYSMYIGQGKNSNYLQQVKEL